MDVKEVRSLAAFAELGSMTSVAEKLHLGCRDSHAAQGSATSDTRNPTGQPRMCVASTERAAWTNSVGDHIGGSHGLARGIVIAYDAWPNSRSEVLFFESWATQHLFVPGTVSEPYQERIQLSLLRLVC